MIAAFNERFLVRKAWSRCFKERFLPDKQSLQTFAGLLTELFAVWNGRKLKLVSTVNYAKVG